MVLVLFTNDVNNIETRSSEPIPSTYDLTSPVHVHNGTLYIFF